MYIFNMKRRIRLTEGDLHRIVKESVKKVIKENWEDSYYWPIMRGDAEKPRTSTLLYIDGESVKQFDDGDPEAYEAFEDAKKKHPNSKVELVNGVY